MAERNAADIEDIGQITDKINDKQNKLSAQVSEQNTSMGILNSGVVSLSVEHQRTHSYLQQQAIMLSEIQATTESAHADSTKIETSIKSANEQLVMVDSRLSSVLAQTIKIAQTITGGAVQLGMLMRKMAEMLQLY
jgi:chromosome segregation ATPase